MGAGQRNCPLGVESAEEEGAVLEGQGAPSTGPAKIIERVEGAIDAPECAAAPSTTMPAVGACAAAAGDGSQDKEASQSIGASQEAQRVNAAEEQGVGATGDEGGAEQEATAGGAAPLEQPPGADSPAGDSVQAQAAQEEQEEKSGEKAALEAAAAAGAEEQGGGPAEGTKAHSDPTAAADWVAATGHNPAAGEAAAAQASPARSEGSAKRAPPRPVAAASHSSLASVASSLRLTFSAPPKCLEGRPRTAMRSNYSHSQQRVRQILRDNDTLVKRLGEIAYQRPEFEKGQARLDRFRANVAASSVARRRAEAAATMKQNLRIYRRLQDVKPSPEVQRGRHERDFEAHQAMLGRLAALRCRGGRHDCGDWSDGGEAGGGRQG